MEMPSVEMMEAVISDFISHEHPENQSDCDMCQFQTFLDALNREAVDQRDNTKLNCLDRMVSRSIASLPMVSMTSTTTGEILGLIYLSRLCFVFGLKVGQMENSVKNLESLIK